MSLWSSRSQLRQRPNGLNPGAGLNGNRTASAGQTAPGAQITTSCYDQADRLTSGRVVGQIANHNPVAAGGADGLVLSSLSC